MESKIIQRIRRCLSLAQSAKGTPEGDLAASRAISMATKAGVDIHSIQLSPSTAAERFFFEPSANSLWRAALGNAICKYVGMEMLRDKERFHLIGRKTDMETWKAFYVRAESEIDAEAKRWIASFGGGKSDGDTFRKSAAYGFGERLARHKMEAEGSVNGKIAASMIHTSSENALVMVGRSLEVKSLKDKLYPRTKSYTTTSNGSHSSRSAGYAFGASMGVHKGSLK